MNSSSVRPCGHHQVQQPERQREIRAGPGRQMQIGLLGGLRAARVDDDQRAAVLPQLGEVAQRRRHGLGEIRADEDHAARCGGCPPAGTAAPGRARTPCCARRPPTTCRSGRCSRSARCRARPGRTCRACTPSRSSARRRRTPRPRPARAARAYARSPSAIAVQGLLPGGRLEPACGGASDQRLGQPHPGGEHRGCRTALAAQRTPVDREVRALLRPRRSPHRHGRRFMPHCRAQYGQCVGTSAGVRAAAGAGDMAPSVRRPCYAGGPVALHPRYAALPAPGVAP